MKKDLAVNEENIIIKDKATIKIGDKIVRASYNLGLMQCRMNNAFLSMINRENNNEAFEECTISIDRLAKLMNLPDDGHQLQVIRRTVMSMGKCSFVWSAIDDPTGDCGALPWFSFIRYTKKEKTVSWQYNTALGSGLLRLREDYFLENLSEFQNFKYSGYSDVFMKLILMDKAHNSDGKKPYYSIDFLREKLCLGNKYPQYSNLRVRILEPVEKDINEFSSYKFKFVPVKDGKKVVGVILDYAAKIKSPFELYPWRQEIKNKLLACGVDVYKATAIAKSEKYSKAYFAANIKAWENAKNLQNPAAALVSFITKNKAGYKAPATSPDNDNLEKTEKNLKTDIKNEIRAMTGADKKKLLDDVITGLTADCPEDIYNIYKPLLLIDNLAFIDGDELDLLAGYVFRLRYPDYPAHDPAEDKNQKPAEAPEEKEQTPEEQEKEAIKAEFLSLAQEEQKNYLTLARQEVENETNRFIKTANKGFLSGDLIDILNDSAKFKVLIDYVYKIRHTELKAKE